MELKHIRKPTFSYYLVLLIVPYGIETQNHCHCAMFVSLLLIVPYGIETLCTDLIRRECLTLLIVPYGIETSYCLAAGCRVLSFNRTLWN